MELTPIWRLMRLQNGPIITFSAKQIIPAIAFRPSLISCSAVLLNWLSNLFISTKWVSQKLNLGMGILKQGLAQYPSSTLLKISLANLYVDTKQCNQLELYLDLSSVPNEADYIAEIASVRFEAGDWKPAYYSYLKAGDRSKSEGCSPSVAESYRNAAAAAFNMKFPAGVDTAVEKMRTRLPDCSETRPDFRDMFMESFNEASAWSSRR